MKIALIGYGRMGKTIEEIALQKGYEVVLKIDRHNLSEFNTQNLSKADVAIEFSNPNTAADNIKTCIDAGIPVICGTTAWLDRLDEVEAHCKTKNGAFLYASNFSIGVNIFFAVNKALAAMMNKHADYEVDLKEIHHTQKLDAPSGTAISLAQDILTQVDRKSGWINEKAINADQLSIISERIDHVPGTHEINYHSPIDSIEIKHTAHSRKGFAMGAVLAAEWIIGKKGSFRMNDVLGF